MSTDQSIAKECKKQIAIHDKHIYSIQRALHIIFAQQDNIYARIESDSITTDIKTSIYTVFRCLVYALCHFIKLCIFALLALGYFISIRETVTYGYFSYLNVKSIAKNGMICSQANIYLPSPHNTICRFPVLKCTNHTHELFYNPQTENLFHNYTEMVEYGRPYLKPYKCDLSYHTTPIEPSNNNMYTIVQTVFTGTQFMYNITFECLRTHVLSTVYNFQLQPEFYNEVFPIVRDGMLIKCK